jgi:hypothetical protein
MVAIADPGNANATGYPEVRANTMIEISRIRK